MLTLFNSLVLIGIRIIESSFFPSIKWCIPGVISDSLFNVLPSEWSWILCLFSLLSEPFFFYLLSFSFYSLEDKPSNQVSFLLYTLLPFNALAVVSSSKFYYSMFSVMLSGFLLDKNRVLSLFLILSNCIVNPVFFVLCGFLFFPSLFTLVSPLFFLLLLHSSKIIPHSFYGVFSYVYADSFSAFHSFLRTIIQGILYAPLFIYCYAFRHHPNKMIRFFVLYSSIIFYEKGPHSLFISLYILSVRCCQQRDRKCSLYVFIMFCCLSLQLSCYRDLIENGSDVFALFFYINCLTYLLYTHSFVRYLIPT